jgi:hypothetical protein
LTNVISYVIIWISTYPEETLMANSIANSAQTFEDIMMGKIAPSYPYEYKQSDLQGNTYHVVHLAANAVTVNGEQKTAIQLGAMTIGFLGDLTLKMEPTPFTPEQDALLASNSKASESALFTACGVDPNLLDEVGGIMGLVETAFKAN